MEGLSSNEVKGWNRAIHPSIVVIVGDKPTYSSAPKRATLYAISDLMRYFNRVSF